MDLQLESVKTAEQSVIGALIMDGKRLADVIDKLIPEHFYFEELKICYQAVLRLSNKGKSIDFVTVLNEIVSSGKATEHDTKLLLLDCVNITPSVSNIAQYSEIVLKLYRTRKLKEIGAKIAFETTQETVEEITNEAMSGFYEVVKSIKTRKLQPIGEIGLQLFETYISGKPPPENRCDTGFKRLDEHLKGMAAGNLIVLAARPKIGKTAFAATIAENVARTE